MIIEAATSNFVENWHFWTWSLLWQIPSAMLIAGFFWQALENSNHVECIMKVDTNNFVIPPEVNPLECDSVVTVANMAFRSYSKRSLNLGTVSFLLKWVHQRINIEAKQPGALSKSQSLVLGAECLSVVGSCIVLYNTQTNLSSIKKMTVIKLQSHLTLLEQVLWQAEQGGLQRLSREDILRIMSDAHQLILDLDQKMDKLNEMEEQNMDRIVSSAVMLLCSLPDLAASVSRNSIGLVRFLKHSVRPATHALSTTAHIYQHRRIGNEKEKLASLRRNMHGFLRVITRLDQQQFMPRIFTRINPAIGNFVDYALSQWRYEKFIYEVHEFKAACQDIIAADQTSEMLVKS